MKTKSSPRDNATCILLVESHDANMETELSRSSDNSKVMIPKGVLVLIRGWLILNKVINKIRVTKPEM